MYVTEEEASVRSRESVESAGSETKKSRTACAWTRSERAFEGEQDRFNAGVVTQSMEGDGMDSLWRAMSVIEGGQGTSAEGKEMREKVVTAVEARLQAGEIQEPLPQGETGWEEYVQKLVQRRRMGGPPEVEAWAAKSGDRVKVHKGKETWRGLQEDTGVWKGEGSACRNPVEEHEGVRGGVGARRAGDRKYSKRGGKRRLGRGGTG